MDRCPPKLGGFVGGAVQTPIGSRAVRVIGASFAWSATLAARTSHSRRLPNRT